MPNKLWRTHPRNYGKDSKQCRVCAARQGLITKYEMMICRRCFREQAAQIGFVKVSLTAENINLKKSNPSGEEAAVWWGVYSVYPGKNEMGWLWLEIVIFNRGKENK